MKKKKKKEGVPAGTEELCMQRGQMAQRREESKGDDTKIELFVKVRPAVVNTDAKKKKCFECIPTKKNFCVSNNPFIKHQIIAAF